MKLTIEQILQKGIAAHREGKLQDAERLYRAILQAQSAHPDANHNLGVLAVSMNKSEAALPLFKNALQANPKVEQFWLSYVDALIKERQFDNAKQVLDQAKKQGVGEERLSSFEAKLGPISQTKNANSLYPSQQQLSSLLEHYQNGRLSDAEKLATSISDQFPSHNFSWKVLGAVFKAKGKISEAVKANQTAVALSTQDAEAHYNLGITLQEIGRLDEAEVSYTQAITLKPDYANAHSNLGNTLQEIGRLDEAEAMYTQAIALKPDYAEAYYNLGNMLQEIGRLDEAEARYTQAIALKPGFAQAHNNLGITLQEIGRLDEAKASYTQAIALKPDYAEAHFNLGNTLKELGGLDEAETSYTQAITLKPGYAEAHNNLGNTLKEIGNLGESEVRYKQAIALKPDYAEAHNNLGNTLKELGRLDEAETSYTQAIALKPDYAEAHFNLGFTLKELGRLDEAKASYKKSTELKYDYAEAKHMLAALSGETTATAPRDYVEGLFDGYAANFESSLVESLEYKIPKVIAETITKDNKSDLLGSIVDLGCGTGLFGVEIKQFCEHLEGIDLSKKMLVEAKKKDVYNKLIKEDILAYLSNATLNFDYFVSTDVFIYIGELSDIFRLIKSRNKTSGKLVFSTEDYNGDGFFLEQSGRYSHSKKYILGLCEIFGYELRYFETQALRKDKNQYISGGLYILDF